MAAEILALYGLTEVMGSGEDDDIDMTLSSQIIESVHATVRKSSEHNMDIIRIILHDAGFDGFNDVIVPRDLDTIPEQVSSTPISKASGGVHLSPIPTPRGMMPVQETETAIILASSPQPSTAWFCCFGENGLRSMFVCKSR